MKKVSEIIDQTHDEIKELSDVKIKELIRKWSFMFTVDLVELNIRQLKDLVVAFFNDVLSETEKKEKKIVERIDGLWKEHSDLQRLLHIEKHIEIPELPLISRQLELDTNLVDLRGVLETRKKQIKKLLVQQQSLCKILDEPMSILNDDPLASEVEIETFQHYTAHLLNLKNEREKTLVMLKSEILQLSGELDLPIIQDPHHSLLYDFNITLSECNVDLLFQLKTDLIEQKNELTAQIINLKEKLEIHWDCLGVDASVREKFFACTGCSQTTYDKLKHELDRCEREKRRNIKVFVDRNRQEIMKLWEQLLMPEQERAQFEAFTSERYSESLLQLHESELDALKKTYEEKKEILEIFDHCNELIERKIALERPNTDRMKNRGGQLLKEEVERKKIARQLQSSKNEISILAAQYEARKGTPFFLRGQNIIDLINGDTFVQPAPVARRKIIRPVISSLVNESMRSKKHHSRNKSKCLSLTRSKKKVLASKSSVWIEPQPTKIRVDCSYFVRQL